MVFQTDKKNKLKWIFFIGTFILSFNLCAVTRYWIGGSSTAWASNANWGTSSGSGSPASFPGFGDVAVFDGGGAANCSLTANVTISTLSITIAYTRTLFQGAFSLIVTGNSFWAGGSFAGGSALINNGGTFNLCGTNFTSSSGTLTVTDSFSFTSGTFNHNNGTTAIGINSLSIVGSPVFYNLTFIAGYNKISVVNSLTVAGNMTLNGFSEWIVLDIAATEAISVNGTLIIGGANQITLNTGSIIANGDISISNTSNTTGGNATIKIAGAGAQTLTGSGTLNKGNLPNVVIDKPSGMLFLSGLITVTGPTWNYVAGTLAAGTSTVCFYNTAVPFTISGTHTLTTVLFRGNYSTYTINNAFTATDVIMDATATCDITLLNAITINGTLFINGSGYYKLNTGTINIKGNVVNTNTNLYVGGGTGSFIINGTSNQTITGTPLINQGPFPPFVINKPSGTLFLTGFITFYNGLTWSAGSVDSGTSTCVFNNVSALGSQSVNASPAGMNFYNVVFDQPDYLWTSLMTDLSIAGSMTITAGSGIKTNGNTIYLAGNFTSLNTTASGSGYVFNGSTGGSFVLNGAGPAPQVLTMNNPTGTLNKAVFYNLTLNNSAARSTNDDIVLNDILTVSNSATFANGKLVSTSAKYFSLKNGATANTGNSASYVNGPMRYEMGFNGSRTLNFPIGENGNWRYITLNPAHNSGTSYTYISEVIGSSPQALGYSLPATIGRVSSQRYTQVDRVLTSSGAASSANLNGNQGITIRYDVNDMVTDYTQLSIAKTTSSGSPWMDIGGVANANTTGTISSTSSPSGFTSFSKFALANRMGGVNPLPVELLYFTATSCDARVCLNWATASENKNAFFTVEKSSDGINFEFIGTLQGSYTSKTKIHYALEDSQPYKNLSYYRLKQTDTDGKFKYYKMVPYSATEKTGDLSVFPNPNKNGKFTFRILENSMDLLIKNPSGILISELSLTKHEEEIDLSYLQDGVYFIILKKTGAATKIIINK